MDKKKPLALETPAMKIQEQYTELLKQIKTEADWLEMLKTSIEHYDYARKGIEMLQKRAKKPKDSDIAEIAHIMQISLLGILISRIGKDLSDCNERLSNLEKIFKTVKW